MALRQIRLEGDELLNKKSKPVKEITASVLSLMDDMRDTLRDKNGLGIAAPQLGVLKRIVIVENEEELFEVINPEIIETEGTQTSNEAFLSIPGLCGDIERPFRIVIRGLDRQGEEIEIDVDDMIASAFCHEIDHLDGVLFVTGATNLRPIDQEELKRRRRKAKRK